MFQGGGCLFSDGEKRGFEFLIRRIRTAAATGFSLQLLDDAAKELQAIQASIGMNVDANV